MRAPKRAQVTDKYVLYSTIRQCNKSSNNFQCLIYLTNNMNYINLSGSLEPRDSNRIPTINEDTANMSTS